MFCILNASDGFVYFTDINSKKYVIYKESMSEYNSRKSGRYAIHLGRFSGYISNKYLCNDSYNIMIVLLCNVYNDFLVLDMNGVSCTQELKVLNIRDIKNLCNDYLIAGILTNKNNRNKLEKSDINLGEKHSINKMYDNIPDIFADKLSIINYNYTNKNKVLGMALDRYLIVTNTSHKFSFKFVYESRLGMVFQVLIPSNLKYNNEIYIGNNKYTILGYNNKTERFICCFNRNLHNLKLPNNGFIADVVYEKTVKDVILNSNDFDCKIRFDENTQTFIIRSLSDVVQINKKESLQYLEYYRNNEREHSIARLTGRILPITVINGELKVNNTLQEAVSENVLEIPDNTKIITKNSFSSISNLEKRLDINSIIIPDKIEYIEKDFDYYLVDRLSMNILYSDNNLYTVFCMKSAIILCKSFYISKVALNNSRLTIVCRTYPEYGYTFKIDNSYEHLIIRYNKLEDGKCFRVLDINLILNRKINGLYNLIFHTLSLSISKNKNGDVVLDLLEKYRLYNCRLEFNRDIFNTIIENKIFENEKILKKYGLFQGDILHKLCNILAKHYVTYFDYKDEILNLKIGNKGDREIDYWDYKYL